MGVQETREREILARDIGASEEEAFLMAFLRRLVRRGLESPQLVISGAHDHYNDRRQENSTESDPP